MMAETSDTICHFYRLIAGAPSPTRADRSANGKLPAEALAYCEPAASASGFGWYMFPPLNFVLTWDGTDIEWSYDDLEDRWLPLRAALAPDFADYFAKIAPEGIGEFPLPFLSQGSQPGSVQVWSGYVARTAPGWALLSRGVANVRKTQPYENYEGILATDAWIGPLVTNIQLRKTDTPVAFHTRDPLFQVQPVRHECYRNAPFDVGDAVDMHSADWHAFGATLRRNADFSRRRGQSAVETRKRLRRECAR